MSQSFDKIFSIGSILIIFGCLSFLFSFFGLMAFLPYYTPSSTSDIRTLGSIVFFGLLGMTLCISGVIIISNDRKESK